MRVSLPMGRDATAWREMVIRYHGAGMTGELRALLMVMAEHMNSRRHVSISRTTLAKIFDVVPRRITERIQLAHELGLLDTVERGQPGRTATYQGLFPGGEHVRPSGFSGHPVVPAEGVTPWSPQRLPHGAPGGTKTRRDQDQLMVRSTAPSDGAPGGTINPAEHGAPGGPPSSKQNVGLTPGLDSVGTHPSLSSVLVVSSESKKLPASPHRKQTDAETQNDEAHPAQAVDPQQTEPQAQGRAATQPPTEPATANAVVAVADRATTWLNDSAVALSTRPTTRCARCGRREPQCRASAAKHDDHQFTPKDDE